MIATLSAKDFILQNIDTTSPDVNNQGKKIILLVKANWCHYCNDYLPMYQYYSKVMPEYKFCILEQTKDEALLKCWKTIVTPAVEVKGYPTLILYENDGMPITSIKDRKNLKKELSDI